MSSLRKYLQTYIEDLQSLMKEHQNDAALLEAAKKRFGSQDIRYAAVSRGSEQIKKSGPEDYGLPSPPSGAVINEPVFKREREEDEKK